MLIVYLFLISLLNIQNSTVNIQIDFLCDDYCTDVLINDISILFEINLDTLTQYHFRTINFIANGGDIITFETYNGGYFGGIAARIIISNNKHSYIFDSKNNENLFSYNILDYSEQQPIADLFYDSQEDSFDFEEASERACFVVVLTPKEGF